ncbi:MAG: holo-ACP synthase [Fimbriimonadaceae bacterium]|nr:holo-ACP synthase [Fimbriimonadaceae bacterium]
MSVKNIGLDVVEVKRIANAMLKPRFVEKILHQDERVAPLDPAHVAGRWAAKEAIAKALGTKPRWHDVIITNDHSGAPVAHVAPDRMPPGTKVMLSISHERNIAAAVALLVESR